MKKRNTLTLILLLAALTLAAQSYSPCYTNNMAKGETAYKQGNYTEARAHFSDAKQCNGGNPAEAQKRINACDVKMKAQQEAAEQKRKAEEAKAAEARRRAEAEEAKTKRFQELKSKSSYSNGNLIIDGVVYKMVRVQGGTFTMGSSDPTTIEFPLHRVTVNDFWIGETEVTQALWKAVMGTEPTCEGGWEDKYGRGSAYPAYRVSWTACQTFIEKLNELTGEEFSLPTEAEWEYAARGGQRSGNHKYAGSDKIDEVAWHSGNSDGKIHPVRTMSPNELGLYDMSGNVFEWCQDWMGKYDSSAQINPLGPSMGSRRVLRGGSMNVVGNACWVTSRRGGSSHDCYKDEGFRLVLSPQRDSNRLLLKTEKVSVGKNTATMYGKIQTVIPEPIKRAGFCLSYKNHTPTLFNTCVDVGDASNEWYAPLNNLRPDTEYYVRSYVITASDKVYYGNVEKFRTRP